MWYYCRMLRKNSRGFTLIELVITITLMTILAFVLITKFSFEPSILNVTGSKLMSDIRYAQSLAVNRGGRYGIEFSPLNDTYSLYVNTPSTKIKDPKNPAADYTVNYRTSKEHSGVDIVETSNFGGDRLEFDWQGKPYAGSGSALSNNGYVKIRNTYATAYVVVIPQTGHVTYQIENPGGGGCVGPCNLIRKK